MKPALRTILFSFAPPNLLTYSEQFDNAAWVNVATTTVTPNTLAAPDGTVSADTLTAGGANSILWQTYSPDVGATYAASIYVARKTGTGGVDITVDGSDWTPVELSAALTRFSASFTSPVGTKAVGIRIRTSGDEVYVWGAMLNKGLRAGKYRKTPA